MPARRAFTPQVCRLPFFHLFEIFSSLAFDSRQRRSTAFTKTLGVGQTPPHGVACVPASHILIEGPQFGRCFKKHVLTTSRIHGLPTARWLSTAVIGVVMRSPIIMFLFNSNMQRLPRAIKQALGVDHGPKTTSWGGVCVDVFHLAEQPQSWGVLFQECPHPWYSG